METKTAWFSKINWTQAVSFLAMIIAFFGFDLPAEQQAEIVAAILAVTNVVTWIIRTWFTDTLTDASVSS
jgi:hypothetical protein